MKTKSNSSQRTFAFLAEISKPVEVKKIEDRLKAVEIKLKN